MVGAEHGRERAPDAARGPAAGGLPRGSDRRPGRAANRADRLHRCRDDDRWHRAGRCPDQVDAVCRLAGRVRCDRRDRGGRLCLGQGDGARAAAPAGLAPGGARLTSPRPATNHHANQQAQSTNGGGLAMRRPNRLLMAVGAALLLLGAPGANSADPVKIRIAYVVPVSNWPSMLLEKQDLARHFGTSYTLEPPRYAGTPQTITALATGDLDLCTLALSSFGLT